MNKGTEELIADLLRAAVKIGVEKWVSKNGEVTTDDYEVDGVTYTDHICNCEIVNGESIRAEFIAKANPAVVMTLIAALEQAQQQNGQLQAERDALREEKIGKESNTRDAADIYFQLIEECNIPPGGSLVQHVDGMRQRIAELEASKLSVKLPDDLGGIINRFKYEAEHLTGWNHIDEHSCKVNRRDLMTATYLLEAIRAAGGTVEGSE